MIEGENKPNFSVFKRALQENPFIQCNTTSPVTPFSASVRVFYASNSAISIFQQIMQYNIVNIDGLYFVVNNYEILQANNGLTLDLDISLDVYLSYVVSFFITQNASDKKVFFKRKHVNRVMYYSNNDGVEGNPQQLQRVTISATCKQQCQPQNFYLNFQKQFYLLELDNDLKNLTNNTMINSYVKNTTWGDVNGNIWLRNFYGFPGN